jgi:hypothetical protein
LIHFKVLQRYHCKRIFFKMFVNFFECTQMKLYQKFRKIMPSKCCTFVGKIAKYDTNYFKIHAAGCSCTIFKLWIYLKN